MNALDAAIGRARGLSTHLLAGPVWEELRSAPDLAALAERLRSGPDPIVLPGPGSASPELLEAAIRRRGGARLATFARWCAEAPDVSRVLLGDEDRRDLRLLIHGVVEGALPVDRLRGTIPTPSLSAAALATLATQTTLGAMVSLLGIWRHPDAAALGRPLGPGPPDLIALDAALTGSWAARATTAAARVDEELQRYVAAGIDLENALTAVMLAGEGREPPELDLVPGGTHLSREGWRSIRAAGSIAAALALAREAFTGTPFQHAMSGAGGAALARTRAWDAALRIARVRSRIAPLSSAPLIAYVLGVRDEVQRLQRLIWGLALGAPPSARGGQG